MSDKLQLQPFELKYIIDESVALVIRDYVGGAILRAKVCT